MLQPPKWYGSNDLKSGSLISRNRKSLPSLRLAKRTPDQFSNRYFSLIYREKRFFWRNASYDIVASPDKQSRSFSLEIAVWPFLPINRQNFWSVLTWSCLRSGAAVTVSTAGAKMCGHPILEPKQFCDLLRSRAQCFVIKIPQETADMQIQYTVLWTQLLSNLKKENLILLGYSKNYNL